MKSHVFVLALILIVSAEQKEGSNLQELEKTFLDNLPTHLDPASIPSLEEGEEALKTRCEKYGRNGTYEEVIAAKEELQVCLKKLINFEEVQKEIEAAKPTGDMDMVFKKYCSRTPEFKDCITNFATVMESCMSENEKATKDVGLNVTDSLLSFVCFKEGDRIALFISEGGPECILEKMEQIQSCGNSTFSKYFPDGHLFSNSTDLQDDTLKEEQCEGLTETQKCVVKELEKCKEPTPGNIVDSLFKFIKKSIPCKETSKASSSSLSPLLLLLISLLIWFK